MLRTHWIATAAALLMVGSSAGSGAVSSAQEGGRPPGEGVICMAMIFSVVAETGRRCYPDRLPEFQAELRQSVAKLDAYILANSDMTPEEYARAKAEQTGADVPDAEFCENELGAVFTNPETNQFAGASTLAEEVDAMVARPGTPTWGTCL